MAIALSPDADFSGLIPHDGAHIKDVIHQAVIDVDEAGTDAAAETAAIIATSGAGTFFPPAAIVLDRPFFFFISDLPTGALLFAGRVNDPTAHRGYVRHTRCWDRLRAAEGSRSREAGRPGPNSSLGPLSSLAVLPFAPERRYRAPSCGPTRASHDSSACVSPSSRAPSGAAYPPPG
ncbi:serpin family protein [Sorangium sp. So ce1128]